MAEVRWTEEAAERLREVHEYIADRSPGAAVATVRGLYALVESLSHFPERGFRHRISSGFEVRVVLYGHYRVVYRIEGQVVVVLGIFHGAMDLPRYLP